MVVSLFEEAKPMRVRAALSRDGVEVFGDYVNMVISFYNTGSSRGGGVEGGDPVAISQNQSLTGKFFEF